MTSAQFYICMCVLALVAGCTEDPYAADYSFEQFEQQFGRQYTGDEREKHRQAFYKNYQELLHLQERSAGQFHLQVNNFTDMTEEQKSSFFGYKPAKLQMPFDTLPRPNKLRAIALPHELNYSAQGKVTPVRNQGRCGSCWAFTSTAMYESQFLINGLGELDLSEQYVLQCTPGSSCDGGWPINALNMFAQKGIPTQNQFPYKADPTFYKADSICSAQHLTTLNLEVESIKHYSSVPDSQLKQLLVDNGPVSVGVRAGDTGLLFYSGGVFSGCDEATTQSQLDHVVLLIGWTKEGHWIVKNSWGTSWGEQGLGVIDRTRNCGLTHFVDVLDVKKAPDSDTKQASINQIEQLNVKLSDSYGDGWNGYIFGVKQRQKIVTVFGQQFFYGSEQGPFSLDIQSGSQAQIVVVVTGQNSHEIGFILTDSTGRQVCERRPGSKFADNIIFCEFCPGCEISSTIDYEYILTDSSRNGWNGTVLAFRQNGVVTSFGEQFVNGGKYGPRKVTLAKKVPVEVVPYKLGDRPAEIGFEIRDTQGNVVLSRQPGQWFQPSQVLGVFCPGCQNDGSIKAKLSQQQTRDIIDSTSPYTGPSVTPYIIAIACLSTITLAMSAVVSYMLYRNRKGTPVLGRHILHTGSVLGSTVTMTDEHQISPDRDRSPERGDSPDKKRVLELIKVKEDPVIQEFKIN